MRFSYWAGTRLGRGALPGFRVADGARARRRLAGERAPGLRDPPSGPVGADGSPREGVPRDHRPPEEPANQLPGSLLPARAGSARAQAGRPPPAPHRGLGGAKDAANRRAACGIVARVLRIPPALRPEQPLPTGFESIGVGGEFYEALRQGRLRVKRAQIAAGKTSASHCRTRPISRDTAIELDTGERIDVDTVVFERLDVDPHPEAGSESGFRGCGVEADLGAATGCTGSPAPPAHPQR
jgi:hypothetical protein